MEFSRAEGPHLVFQLSGPEKALLVELTKLYPLVPSTYDRLAQDPLPEELQDAQKLLQEAMAEQNAELQQKLQTLLKASDRFKSNAKGWQWRLENSEVEWLLLVFNDIRVGSWIKLGSPDENSPRTPYHESMRPYLFAMEASLFFQTVLLRGLHHRTGS